MIHMKVNGQHALKLCAWLQSIQYNTIEYCIREYFNLRTYLVLE